MDDIEQQLRDAARQWIEDGGSQNQLAKTSGVSQSAISDFMRGAGVRLHIAAQIAAAMGRRLKLTKKRKGE